jgi:D-glycero-alpha-D-manno-heptose-7-phosphate kinase
MREIIAIRSKAPLRLGLAGGGTDVSPYCDEFGGIVLNATISLFAYCTIVPRNNGNIVIHLADFKETGSFTSDKKLPTDNPYKLCIAVYNRVISDFSIDPLSFEITTYSDAPAGSGLGSSSAMVVAVLRAFVEWLDLPLGEYDLANLAYSIEREDLKMSGGKQDQYASAFGGFNFIEFYSHNRVIVNPLRIKRWIIDELESSLILYYTGASRFSSKIIDEQKANSENKKVEAIQAMHSLKESAISLKSAVLKGDTDEFARILGDSWIRKKQMATGISNDQIDEVMRVAVSNGAVSGKVSGAGGGGFIFFFVKPENKASLKFVLSEMDGDIFDFQFTEGGCHSWKIFNN